jgi:hypothetical protein
MSSCDVSNDIVAFCSKRNTFDVAITNGAHVAGLANPDELQACLQNGEYIPVLKAIWSERDLERRVSWLRQYSSLHAPLMFELAMAEFEHSPTRETLAFVSFPLIHAAASRVLQDCSCSVDRIEKLDAKAPDIVIRQIYFGSIDLFLTKIRCKAVLQFSEDTNLPLLEKTKETMRQSLSAPLPTPEWLKAYGKSLLGREIIMASSSEWKQRRVFFARELLKNKNLQPMFSLRP